MKPVVMSEGRRDVKLVECYYEYVAGDFEVQTFIGEEISHSRQSNRESELIRNFPEPWNPFDVLVKSENGIEDLKLVFGKLAKFLLAQNVQLCLLVDLDGGDHSDFLDDLTEHVQSSHGNHFEISFGERIERSSAMVATRNHLLDDAAVRGSFEVLAFHSRLESATNIDKEKDSEKVQDRKLREFVRDDRASPLHTVL